MSQLDFFQPKVNEQIQKSFHNTIKAIGEQLEKFEKSARSLEDQVLQCFYTTHINSGMTRREVFEIFGSKYVETSCGRALTNLETRKKIYKSEDMRDGLHGKGNFVYKLIQR